MKARVSARVGLAAIAAAIAAGSYYLSASKVADAPAPPPLATAPLATPLGITLQPVGAAQGFAIDGRPAPPISGVFDVTFADAKGMTLYTNDNDTPGHSNCVNDCAKTWPPAIADRRAQSAGDWSVIAHDDGSGQWAYRDRPLYRFVEDKDPGSVGGNSPRAAKPGTPRAEAKPVPDGWHAALYKPAADIALPHGIAVRDVAEAGGQSLVDGSGMTLYMFQGDARGDKPACPIPAPCRSPWIPLAAPQLAEAPLAETGRDFSLLIRNDGIKQWVYKGRALYRFEGDLSPGFANGADIDPRWRVALVSRYFMPPEASIRPTRGRGKVLATAAGLTLYRRVVSLGAAGHSFRHGVPTQPAAGREMGTKGCNAECLKVWHPLAAPADAQPSGFWDVVIRDDGIRQWAYCGYALYSFAGDRKPGDMTGNDIYDVALSEDPAQALNIDSAAVGAAALDWLIAEP